MRTAVLVVFILVLVLLSAAVAPFLMTDPGVVQIRIRGWTIEMSVLVLLAGIVLAWIVIHFLLRLWQLPAETARRLREQRAARLLEKGLLALTEGDWITAERALQKSTAADGQGTARYLAAAQAADSQSAGDRAEQYLVQADSGGSRNHFLVELMRARLMTDNGRYEEALPVLENLRVRRKRHAQVLELLSRCYQALGRWQDLQGILPVMQKSGLLDDARAEELKNQAGVSQLELCADAAQLQAAWNALPRNMQKSQQIVLAFANRAVKLGSPELVEPVVRASLKQQWNSELLHPYGFASATDASQRMKQCEKWLADHPDDGPLHLALGRICAREELWGKARFHMIRSLEISPSVAGYDAFGHLLERQGELETAMACFRNALRLKEGDPPLPLPSEHMRLSGPIPVQ